MCVTHIIFLRNFDLYFGYKCTDGDLKRKLVVIGLWAIILLAYDLFVGRN